MTVLTTMGIIIGPHLLVGIFVIAARYITTRRRRSNYSLVNEQTAVGSTFRRNESIHQNTLPDKSETGDNADLN